MGLFGGRDVTHPYCKSGVGAEGKEGTKTVLRVYLYDMMLQGVKLLRSCHGCEYFPSLSARQGGWMDGIPGVFWLAQGGIKATKWQTRQQQAFG